MNIGVSDGNIEYRFTANNDDEWLSAQTQYNIDLLDMDSAVMMFWYLVQSGLLDKQHVFHQQGDAFLDAV